MTFSIMDVTGTGVGITIRREARSISGIPLTSWQGEAENIITDEDFVRILLRLLIARDDMEEIASSWSTFNETLADNKSEKPPTVIAYGPLLPESPTNPAAVQSSLDYCMQLTRKLGQESTVVTVDQAIYDVVKGVVLSFLMNVKQVKMLILSFLFFQALYTNVQKSTSH